MEQIEELLELIEKSKNIVENLELISELEAVKLENIKLRNDINIMEEKLKQKTDDMSNLTKVSMIQSINKQLNEKNNYITILEGQLEKFKNTKIRVEQNVIPEKKSKVEEALPEKKSKVEEALPEKKSKVEEALPEKELFDSDNFEEINGYELICYKKKYYLRDLETNELYDIINNMPNKVVGLISSSGKAKLN